MTPTVWVVLAVVACFLSGLGIVRFVTMDRPPEEPVRAVTQCDLDGHGLRYRSRDLHWSCATCGEKLSHEGALSDQTKSVGAFAQSVSATGPVLAGLGNKSGRLVRH